MKKKIIVVICSLLVAIVMLYLMQALLIPKYQGDIVEGSMIAEYYKETLNHEVLFIGDCEVYENFSPMTLWEEYGITSYIRGSAQQMVWQSYYLLEDTLRYETPEVVVFNVLALKYNEPQREAYNRMTIDGMRWTRSKIECIEASMTEDEKMLDYLLPILRYHARWSELSSEDFEHIFTKDKVTHNGYYMRVDVKPQGKFPSAMPLPDYTLGSNSMMYLDKITKLCQDNGIELVLIKAPTEYPHWFDEWDEQIEDYANDNNLTYINMIPLKDEIGLDMAVDTYDGGLHLNLSGATKLSTYFGQYLVDNYQLSDYRTDEAYAKVYSDKLDFYYKMIDEQKARFGG